MLVPGHFLVAEIGVNEDSLETGMPQPPWNGGLLAAGLLSCFAFLVAPFFLALPLALAFAFGPVLIHPSQASDPSEKKTKQHGQLDWMNCPVEVSREIHEVGAGVGTGEKMVLRLLGRQAALATLASLGFTDRMRKQLQPLDC